MKKTEIYEYLNTKKNWDIKTEQLLIKKIILISRFAELIAKACVDERSFPITLSSIQGCNSNNDSSYSCNASSIVMGSAMIPESLLNGKFNKKRSSASGRKTIRYRLTYQHVSTMVSYRKNTSRE